MMSRRVLPLVVFALVTLRAMLPAHAPAAVDAHLALAALVLALAQPVSRAALLAGGLVVVGALMSLPLSWHPVVSALALPAIVGPAAFFLIATQRLARSGVLWGLALGGVANASAALVQRVWLWPDALARHAQELDASLVSRLSEARTIGMSLSPDLCGALCIAGACAAAALAIEAPYRERRLLPAVLALVSLSGVVVVRSFGSALALGAGAGLVAIVVLARRASRATLWAALGGLAAAGIALSAAFITRGAAALAASASERIANWRIALDIFASAPATGVGLARFPAAYLIERTPDSNVTRYAHSGPLHWLAETGVVGGLLLAVAVAVVVTALWRGRATLNAAQLVLLAGAGALTARTLIDYDAQVAQTASVLALVIGALLVRDGERADLVPRRVTLAAAVAMVPIVLVLFWRESALADDADDASLRAYAARITGDPQPRLALGARAVDRLHSCQDAAACRAAHAAALSLLDEAAAAARPSDVVFVLRARVHAHAGALDLAERDVDAALALNPGSAAAHRLAVQLAQALGDDGAARREAAKTWHVVVE